MKTEYNSPTEEHNGSPYLYGPTVENLVSAIRGGADIRVIQRIMDSPILDVNEYDRDSGSYAYEAAIMMGRNDVAQLLLDNGAHVKGDENHPPSRKELEDEILIERVFGNKSLTEYGYINGEEERKNNPLRIYSEKGFNFHLLIYALVNNAPPTLVGYIIDQGVDVNERDRNGDSALHYAVSKERSQHIKLLIERGANVNAVNGRGISVLRYAARTGNAEIVEMLLQAGAKLYVGDGVQKRSVLCYVARTGNLRILKLLLEAGIDPCRELTRKGNTPLHCACGNVSRDKGRVWDQPGTEKFRVPPQEIYERIIVTLVEAGLDPNAMNEDGKVPMRFSIKADAVEEVKLLLRMGADLSLLLDPDETPVDYAISASAWSCANFFVEESFGIPPATA